jgi:hypothetical protein
MTLSWLVGASLGGRRGDGKAKPGRAGRIRGYAKAMAADADRRARLTDLVFHRRAAKHAKETQSSMNRGPSHEGISNSFGNFLCPPFAAFEGMKSFRNRRWADRQVLSQKPATTG